MVDLLKPKETPKVSPEKVEQAALEPESGQEIETREQEPRSEQLPEHVAEQQAQHEVQEGHVSQLKERVAAPETKSERLIEIERILSDDLKEVYEGLDADIQKKVKREGEKIASDIENLIEEGSADAKKVLAEVRDWMHEIPGVNKFFLEQESKRKTDKIMAMARKTRPDAYA